MFLIFLLYALFGSSFVLGKMALTCTTPFFLTGIRMTAGGLILLTYLYTYSRKELRFNWSHISWFAQMTFFGIYITYALRFWALGYMPAAKTNFIYNLSPFISALFSFTVLHEKLSSKKLIGLAIGLLGIIPILISSSGSEQTLGEFAFLSWPEIAAMISVATHTYSWIIMRKLVKEYNYSPMTVNGICMTSAGILGFFTSLYIDGPMPIKEGTFTYFFSVLTLVIIISNIICCNLYGWLLKKYTATFLSFAGFLSPIFTALYGWLLIGETVTWHFYLSCAIVFSGLYLFYQEELQDTSIIYSDIDIDLE
jgi:drug/metabolite transporter (DMT)-like permease